MGAHSLLMRKVNKADADMLIRSGKTYKARFLQSLGLVEQITTKGTSVLELYKFTASIREQFNFEYHHIQCKKMIHSLSKTELLNITNLWVDACMKISKFDLRKMEILVNAQKRRKPTLEI